MCADTTFYMQGEYDGGEIESYQATRNLEEEDEEEQKVPDWVVCIQLSFAQLSSYHGISQKFGGMVLGAAAAVGLGVWAYHEYKERKEEEEEEEEAKRAIADHGYGDSD